jgi:hypothetical protein
MIARKESPFHSFCYIVFIWVEDNGFHTAHRKERERELRRLKIVGGCVVFTGHQEHP